MRLQSTTIMMQNPTEWPCTYGPVLGCSRIFSGTFSDFDDSKRSRGRSL